MYSYRIYTAAIWLKYCRYGVKHYPINRSISYVHVSKIIWNAFLIVLYSLKWNLGVLNEFRYNNWLFIFISLNIDRFLSTISKINLIFTGSPLICACGEFWSVIFFIYDANENLFCGWISINWHDTVDRYFYR